MKNWLRGRCGVENALKMLIYKRKLRFLGRFRLASPASPTFFKKPVETGGVAAAGPLTG
ncbi:MULTISPECIES: hypothetical protein [Pseudomonadaceae]|uniref:hypothetical protein n=1 Tax=Pseudomonadaceae TaxID=135621 RepID=UPI00135BB079|nr:MULTISPECIES: hypothetical protein [Pseudomonas]MCP1620135.1 hypothetical protein [Pseudomonas otitidis]